MRAERSLMTRVTTYDTCSMVCCIVESAIDPSWVITPSDKWVKGVGGKIVKSSGVVTVPNHSFVYCGSQHDLQCDIIESLPRGIQILIGLPTIVDARYSLVPDLFNYRCYTT